jgi:hypothetical protein
MAAMLHVWWRLYVDTDAGGPGSLGFRRNGGERGRRGTIGGDGVLSDGHGRAGEAIGTMARRGDGPGVRKSAEIRVWQRG